MVVIHTSAEHENTSLNLPLLNHTFTNSINHTLIAVSYRLSECDSINEQCWNLALRVDGLV